MEVFEINYSLNLVNNLSKRDVGPKILKAAHWKLSTQDIQNEWLHVYTTGSLINKT